MSAIEHEVPEVLHVLKSEGIGLWKSEIRIVQWTGRPPLLEKKRYIKSNRNGEVLPLKHVGFTLNDLEFIRVNFREIELKMGAL